MKGEHRLTSPLLEVRGITKIFTSGVVRRRATVALEDFSLAQPDEPAAITTIAGESGSGKTTLANAILGFINLTAGQIFYLGQDITTLTGQDATNYRR